MRLSRRSSLPPSRQLTPRAPNHPPAAHVTALAANPDGSLVGQLDGVLGADGTPRTSIALFDAATGRQAGTEVQVALAAGTLAIDPAGTRFVVSGGYDGEAQAFDLATGDQIGRLAGMPPGEDLANQLWTTAGPRSSTPGNSPSDHVADQVRLVDPATLTATAPPITVPTNTTTKLVVINGGAKLLGAGLNGVVLIDVHDGTIDWSLDSRTVAPGKCNRFTIVAERRAFYCFDSFGQLEERGLTDGTRLRQLDAQNGTVGSVWPARHGTELVAFNLTPVVARWRLDGSGPITRRIAPGLAPSQYSPDGRHLIAATPYGTYLADDVSGSSVVIDTSSGEVVASLGDLDFGFWQDDDTIGGVVFETDGAVAIVNYELSTEEVTPPGIPLTVQFDSVVTNAGQPKSWASTRVDDDTWEIWTAERPSNARIGPTITVDHLIDISGSRAGHRLAATTTDGVILYDADTGRELARIEGRQDLQGVFFVDDHLLALSSVRGDLGLYDADTLAKVRTINGSRGFIERLQPTADGALIAAQGGDQNVQLIDVATGAPIGGPIQIPLDERRGIALQPTGSQLAVGGGTATGSPSGISIRRTGSPPPAASPVATSPAKNGTPTSAR